MYRSLLLQKKCVGFLYLSNGEQVGSKDILAGVKLQIHCIHFHMGLIDHHNMYVYLDNAK